MNVHGPKSGAARVPGTQTRVTMNLLRAVSEGQVNARDQLLGHLCERIRIRARQELRQFRLVRRFAQTDDVLNQVLERLDGALEKDFPKDPIAVLAVTAKMMRQVLVDLHRSFSAKKRNAGRDLSDVGAIGGSRILRDRRLDRNATKPYDRAMWEEFIDQVQKLPSDLLQVVDLHMYHGMSQPEVAEALGVSVETVKNRWRDARVQLGRLVKDWREG